MLARRTFVEKLNLVRRQFPCNKSAQENEKQNTYKSVVKKEDAAFFFILFFLFSLIIWSPRALQSTFHEMNVPMWEEKICLNVLVVEVQIETSSRFAATVDYFLCCIY